MEKLYQEMLNEQKNAIANRRSTNMVSNQISDYYISNMHQTQRDAALYTKRSADFLVKGVSEALDISQYYINKRMNEKQKQVADSPELAVKVAKSQNIVNGVFQQYVTENVSPNVTETKTDEVIERDMQNLFVAARDQINKYITEENITGYAKEALIAKNEAYLKINAKSIYDLEKDKQSTNVIGADIADVLSRYNDSQNQTKADLLAGLDAKINGYRSTPLLFAKAKEIAQDTKFEIMLSDAESIEEATQILKSIAAGNYKWNKYSDNAFDELTPKQKAENSEAAKEILSGEKSDAKIAMLFERSQLFTHDSQENEGRDFAQRKIIELERKSELKQAGLTDSDLPLPDAKFDYFENNTPNNINSNDAAVQENALPINVDVTNPVQLGLHIVSIDDVNEKQGTNLSYFTKPIIGQFIQLFKEGRYKEITKSTMQIVQAAGERVDSYRISTRDSLRSMRDSLDKSIKDYSGEDENALYGMIGLLNIIETHLQETSTGITTSFPIVSGIGVGASDTVEVPAQYGRVSLETTKEAIDNHLSRIKNNNPGNVYTEDKKSDINRGIEIALNSIDGANMMAVKVPDAVLSKQIKVLYTYATAANNGRGTSDAREIKDIAKVLFPEWFVHGEFLFTSDEAMNYLDKSGGAIINVDEYLEKNSKNGLTPKQIKDLRAKAKKYKQLVQDYYYQGKKFFIARAGNGRSNIYLMLPDGSTANLMHELDKKTKGLGE